MISYKYKLYQSKKTIALGHMMCEAAFVWNHALALQKRYHSLAKALGWDKSYIKTARMQAFFAKRIKPTRLHSQTVQEILQRQDASFGLFFKHVTRRPPKFRKAEDFGSPAKFRGRCIVHGMAGCVKTEKAALAGPPSPVVSTAAVAVKFD